MRASSSSLRWPAGEHARRLACQLGERDEVEQAHRLLDVEALLPEHRLARQPVGQDALADLAARGGQHVLQHAHLSEQARDLEGAAEAEREPAMVGEIVDAALVQ